MSGCKVNTKLYAKSKKEGIKIALLTVNDLTLAYGEHEIIRDLSFQIQPGEFLVVVGENGVGKTTLVRALFHQLKPRHGQIEFAAGTRLGYVPQFRNLARDYPLSVRDFVALNLPLKLTPWLSKKERQQVTSILRQTNLLPLADRPLGVASGGEKQRAYLAQALLAHPQLLILDESTASLDNEVKYELLDLVTKFQMAGLTVMFITHDWALAKHYGSRFLHLTKTGYTTGPIAELPASPKGGAE